MGKAVRRRQAPAQDVPTWAYRVSLAGAVLIFGGLCVWFLTRLISDFDSFGVSIQKVREDQTIIRGDINVIKKDVDRIDKGQQRQDEKAERFERDTKKDFQRIEEKLDRKQDKK